MLSHLRKRVAETLRASSQVILASTGAAGLQVNACSCYSRDLTLYLLVPRHSEHLVNAEQPTNVVVSGDGWRLNGVARVLDPCQLPDALPGLQPWQAVIQVQPSRFEMVAANGEGISETIDVD